MAPKKGAYTGQRSDMTDIDAREWMKTIEWVTP